MRRSILALQQMCPIHDHQCPVRIAAPPLPRTPPKISYKLKHSLEGSGRTFASQVHISWSLSSRPAAPPGKRRSPPLPAS
eukprot:2243-Chlamydomonas_euryale.AAC.2